MGERGSTKISFSVGEKNILTVGTLVTQVGQLSINPESGLVNLDLNNKKLVFAKKNGAESIWPDIIGALPKEDSENSLIDLFLPKAEANQKNETPLTGSVIINLVLWFIGSNAEKSCSLYQDQINICEFNLKTCGEQTGCTKNLDRDVMESISLNQVLEKHGLKSKCPELVKIFRSCLLKLHIDHAKYKEEFNGMEFFSQTESSKKGPGADPNNSNSPQSAK